MDFEDRKVPFSLSAEQALLGSILIKPEIFGEISQQIKIDDFYKEEYQGIYSTLLKFNLAGENIDFVKLQNQLVIDGVYDDQQKVKEALIIIGNSVATSSNAKDYAKIVKDKSMLRKLIRISEEILEDAYAGNEEAKLIVDSAEQRIFDLSQNNEVRDFRSLSDILRERFKELQVIKEKGVSEDQLGIPTQYSSLDKILVGMGKGNLIIVGARPGVGKTSFCLNVATNVAKATKKSVAIFSLEMSSEELADRLLSCEAMVPNERMRTGALNNEDWSNLANACSALAETNILIDDTTGTGLTAMKGKLRRIKDLGLVVVDYLQLMESDKIHKGEINRVGEIAEITRGLKILAKELNVPVIVCSQLSRGTEKEHKKPMLSDLRDSGSIEQDADVVIFLSRDYYGEDPEKSKLVQVMVAKNRHGSTGEVTMGWLPEYTKFMVLDTKNEAQSYQPPQY